MNYDETVRTIYGQTSSATADTSSAGAARARRLCAGLVVAGALFGSAGPARADDGLAAGALSGGSIATTVATVQAAAVAQASAIANEAVSAAASSSQPAPAPAPSEPQTGSASGVAGGISSDGPTAPAEASAQPPAAPSATPAAAATTTAPVVAPSTPVVSTPPAADTPPASSPDTIPDPSAALHRLAREYQKNPGRYHSVNSLPISHESGALSSVQSLVKRVPFASESSTPNSNPIPASNCRESETQSGCGESTPRPSHAHVGAVATSAPADSSAVTHPDAVAVPAVDDPPDRPAVVVAISARSLVPHPASVRTARPRHAAATPAEKALPGPAVNASPPKTSAPRRADAGSVPQHVGGTQSRRVKIPSQTAQRESARADHRPSESIWPWLGLALLLAGLTSISLAAVSVGARGAAAIPLLAARLRTTRPSVTGIATRMRSKGLSAGANGRVADRPRERRGIRYRD